MELPLPLRGLVLLTASRPLFILCYLVIGGAGLRLGPGLGLGLGLGENLCMMGDLSNTILLVLYWSWLFGDPLFYPHPGGEALAPPALSTVILCFCYITDAFAAFEFCFPGRIKLEADFAPFPIKIYFFLVALADVSGECSFTLPPEFVIACYFIWMTELEEPLLLAVASFLEATTTFYIRILPPKCAFFIKSRGLLFVAMFRVMGDVDTI